MEAIKLSYGKRSRRKSGSHPFFSALAIVAALYVAAQILAITALMEHSARARARLTLSHVTEALRAYHSDYDAFPDNSTGLAVLSTAPAGSKNWRGPYINRIGNDPWNHPYVYHPTPNGGYVLFSMGPDGKAGTIDDICAEPSPSTMPTNAPSAQ